MEGVKLFYERRLRKEWESIGGAVIGGGVFVHPLMPGGFYDSRSCWGPLVRALQQKPGKSYECDRCHKQSRDEHFVQRILLPRLNYTEREFLSGDSDSKELCAECVRVLRMAWETPPQGAKLKYDVTWVPESHGSSRLERD